jgi:putative transposase
MKLTRVNQLWVADITYIRLEREFVYLAVILDGFSRRVVGWELDRTLAVRLPLTALEHAITCLHSRWSGGPSRTFYSLVAN